MNKDVSLVGNLNVGYNTDMTSFSDAVSDYVEFTKGYVYPIDDIFLENEEYENFKVDLFEEFTGVESFDYSKGKSCLIKLVHPNFYIYVRGTTSGDKYIIASCANEETALFIHKLGIKHSKVQADAQIVMTTYTDKSSSSKFYDKDEFSKISKSYYPYIKTDVMFQQFFTGKESIMLLVGKPGLGKSKLVSHMLDYAVNNTEFLPTRKVDEDDVPIVSVGYIKSTEVLATEKFWDVIGKQNHDFIILDDLDYMLTKREAQMQSSDDKIKNMFLNYFLPFTDGISENKTKFIITTNQPYDNIDTAILRKGRLFDILELRELTPDEAKVIWLENELSEASFDKIFSGIHEINPAHLGSEISKMTNKRLKKLEPYLLEDGISKIVQVKRSKRMGV